MALDPDVERYIMEHINSLLQPLVDRVETIAEDNKIQSNKMQDFDEWLHELFGNGRRTGKGFMERARDEDKTVQTQLFKAINDVKGTVAVLTQEKLEAQIEMRVRKQIAEEKKDEVQTRREVQSLRLSKWQLIAALISIPAFAYFLEPIKHFIVSLLK